MLSIVILYPGSLLVPLYLIGSDPVSWITPCPIVFDRE